MAGEIGDFTAHQHLLQHFVTLHQLLDVSGELGDRQYAVCHGSTSLEVSRPWQ